MSKRPLIEVIIRQKIWKYLKITQPLHNIKVDKWQMGHLRSYSRIKGWLFYILVPISISLAYDGQRKPLIYTRHSNNSHPFQSRSIRLILLPLIFLFKYRRANFTKFISLAFFVLILKTCLLKRIICKYIEKRYIAKNQSMSWFGLQTWS